MKKYHLELLIPIVLVLAVVHRAEALSLAPGYDLYSVTGGSFIAVDFDGPGGQDPIPVAVQGQPIDSTLFYTDMIVERKLGGDLNTSGDTITVPIEIVALSLQSTAPVLYNGNYYNVELFSGRLLSDPLSPFFKQATIPTNQDGTSTIKKGDSVGGTFSSFFDVFFEIKITDTSDPTNVDSIYQQYLWDLQEAPWVETPGHTYPSVPTLPSGNFYSGNAQGNAGNLGQLNLTPATTPEPLSLLLMSGGLAGLLGLRRKKRFYS